MYMYMSIPCPPPSGSCSWHPKSRGLHKDWPCALVAESMSPCEIMCSGDLLSWCYMCV